MLHRIDVALFLYLFNVASMLRKICGIITFILHLVLIHDSRIFFLKHKNSLLTDKKFETFLLFQFS